MHIAIQRDIGAHLHTVPAVQIDAAGATATTANGAAFNRLTGANDLFLSCKVVLQVVGGVDTTAGTLVWNMQHSVEGTTWVDFGDKDGSTVQTATVTTGSDAVSAADFDLSSARQFIRVQAAVNKVTTSSSESIHIGGAIVLGGGDENPAD